MADNNRHWKNEEKKDNSDLKGQIIVAIATLIIAKSLNACSINSAAKKYEGYKAIVYGQKSVTILDVERAYETSKETRIVTPEGVELTLSTEHVELINEEESSLTAEDIAINKMGPSVDINYLDIGNDNDKTLTKNK